MIESKVRMTETKYALLLLLVLLCSNMTVGNSYSQESFQENIYVQVFLGFPPGETLLVQNTVLEFKNIPDGPPINTSLEAFNDPFVKADFKGIGYFMNIDVYYLSTVQIEKAYTYADQITQEFLKVFDYPQMQRISKSHQIDDATNTIKIKQQFNCTTPSAHMILLKYKPEIGFGKLIDNFLEKYTASDASGTTGLTDMYYTLQKTNLGFSWNLVIGGSIGKTFSSNTTEIINLNELLNNSLPILASTHQSSIIIEIEKNRTRKIGDSILTYTLIPEDIRPDGYAIIDTEYYYVRRYEDLTTPLNDVIVKVKIGKILPHDYPWMAITIGIIGTIAVIVVACVKKRKTRRNIKMRRKKISSDHSPFFCP
jgi:hypothetical protein